MFELSFSLEVLLYQIFQLGIAFILSLPIALNREMKNHGAGLRTFPLVTIASCAFMMVGINTYQDSAIEARVMYGIITGMGFIGGGAIFKSEDGVKGTATAASLWNTAAIGISVAYESYETAVILSIVSFLILNFSKVFFKVEKKR